MNEVTELSKRNVSSVESTSDNREFEVKIWLSNYGKTFRMRKHLGYQFSVIPRKVNAESQLE